MKKFVYVLLAFTLTFSSALPCWSQTTDATSSTATHGHADCQEEGRVDGSQTPTGGAFSIGPEGRVLIVRHGRRGKMSWVQFVVMWFFERALPEDGQPITLGDDET